MPTGNYTPWPQSDARREMQEALAEVGVTDYAALADRPRAVRDDFHARWTAKMHQRCGIDPTQPPARGERRGGRTGILASNKWAARVERENRIVAEAEAGATAEEIGWMVGVSGQHVRKILRDRGLQVPGIKRYARRAA